MIIEEPYDSSDEETGHLDATTGSGHARSRTQVKRSHQSGTGTEANGDSRLGVDADMDAGVGTAYMESMVSKDGFTRGPNGRIKFNKDTRKRRREEAEFEIGMEVDEHSLNAVTTAKPTLPANKKLKEKEKQKKLGHEFKAKVLFSISVCGRVAN
jgi:ribosomal RNA-processing protein 12